MKIAITGHTSGLGQAIYDHMIKLGHEVVGFSKSTGYDISLAEDRARIIEQAKSCDLFFNNAHSGIAQTQLLLALASHVSVITSGSMAAEFTKSGGSNPYTHEKLNIQNAHAVIKRTVTIPHLLIRMGYLEDHDNVDNPVKYQEIIEAVEYWLLHPRVTLIEFDNQFDYYSQLAAANPNFVPMVLQYLDQLANVPTST